MALAPAPFLGPGHLGPLGGTKRSNIIKSELQSQISKIFKPNFVYLLTNERYLTYQPGFLFGLQGHAKGWDLRVPWWGRGGGGFNKSFPEIQPDLVCVTHMNGTCTGTIFWVPAPWGLGKGSKI